ncbi:MAG: hypothetical protein IJS15_03850, partial [Victivallales bacterium]|nr:hypothetical protein [Victivallales bacterium]
TGPTGGVCVHFNGVLLNASELRRDAAESPSEIVSRLYQENGTRCFDMLNGPFAIAIEDYRKGDCQFVLARDHHGQMGLCYRFADGKVEYGTEVSRGGTIDIRALGTYLSLGYIPAPMTIYREWRRVPSGSLVVFAGDSVEGERFWTPEISQSCTLNFDDAVAHAMELIERAVGRCLAFDPDAGMLLSGGIDSNVVMTIAKKVLGAAPKAFTVGFSTEAFDERGLASLSAKAAGAEHVTRLVQPTDYSVVREILAAHPEPFADSSLFPDSMAMRLAAEQKRTVLTGDGGDELFGGYRRYRSMAMRDSFGDFPSRLIGKALSLGMAVLPRNGSPRGRLATARRMAHAFSLPPIESYASFQELFTPKDVRRLYPAFADTNGDYYDDWRRLFADCPARELAAKCNYIDLLTYLPDDGCIKEGLSASGTGLTVLSPLLDMDVTRFALSLPLEFKHNRREGKRVLRAIASSFLPDELMHIPKRGFGMPLSDWLRGPLSHLMNDCLSNQGTWDVEKCLSPSILSMIVMGHNSSAIDCGAGLWAINCLKECGVLQ